jgi:hypothetical protein
MSLLLCVIAFCWTPATLLLCSNSYSANFIAVLACWLLLLLLVVVVVVLCVCVCVCVLWTSSYKNPF